MLLMKHPVLSLPAERVLSVTRGEVCALPVAQGQLLTIIDRHGGQPAALFAVNLEDARHFLSAHHTRVFSNSFVLRLGMRLVSNRRRPVMVLGRDTAGAHDLLMPVHDPDSATAGQPGERFKDKVRAAFARSHVDLVRVPDPVNLFLNVNVSADGRLVPMGLSSIAGSLVTLRVVMNVIVAVAAPRPDERLWNASSSGALDIHVHNRPDAF